MSFSELLYTFQYFDHNILSQAPNLMILVPMESKGLQYWYWQLSKIRIAEDLKLDIFGADADQFWRGVFGEEEKKGDKEERARQK